MAHEITFKISDELFARTETQAERRGLSVPDAAIELLSIGLDVQKHYDHTNETMALTIEAILDSSMEQSAADLDRIAVETGAPASRGMVDDGRAPDILTGVPLESDAELRARLLSGAQRSEVVAKTEATLSAQAAARKHAQEALDTILLAVLRRSGGMIRVPSFDMRGLGADEMMWVTDESDETVVRLELRAGHHINRFWKSAR